MKTAMTKLIALALSAAAVSVSPVTALAVSKTNVTAENISVSEISNDNLPILDRYDENGNLVESIEFKLANTYYVNPEIATVSGDVAPLAIVTPDPSTNYYDLKKGEYAMYFGQSKTVYEMDKWFHANSSGKLYISAHMIDADGKIMFYRYNFDDTTHFWLLREYELELNSTNSRARDYNDVVRNLDTDGEKYYTFLVTSTGDKFSSGLIKASWNEIEDPYDFN